VIRTGWLIPGAKYEYSRCAIPLTWIPTGRADSVVTTPTGPTPRTLSGALEISEASQTDGNGRYYTCRPLRTSNASKLYC